MLIDILHDLNLDLKSSLEDSNLDESITSEILIFISHPNSNESGRIFNLVTTFLFKHLMNCF